MLSLSLLSRNIGGCVSITYEMEPASVLLIEANVANRRRREDEKKEASEQDEDDSAAAFIAVSCWSYSRWRQLPLMSCGILKTRHYNIVTSKIKTSLLLRLTLEQGQITQV